VVKTIFFPAKTTFVGVNPVFQWKKTVFFRQLAQNLPTLLHVCIISCRISSYTTRWQGYTKKAFSYWGQYAVGPLAN